MIHLYLWISRYPYFHSKLKIKQLTNTIRWEGNTTRDPGCTIIKGCEEGLITFYTSKTQKKERQKSWNLKRLAGSCCYLNIQTSAVEIPIADGFTAMSSEYTFCVVNNANTGLLDLLAVLSN